MLLFKPEKMDLNFKEERALYIYVTDTSAYIYVSYITVLTFILLEMRMPPLTVDSYSRACIHTHTHPHTLNKTSFSFVLANIFIYIYIYRISHEIQHSQLYAIKAMKQHVFRPMCRLQPPHAQRLHFSAPGQKGPSSSAVGVTFPVHL